MGIKIKKLDKILLVSHKMNLGGTEKALLAFINSLKDQDLDITLLLLEKGGVLEDSIPGFVKVKYFEGFDQIMPVIQNPPINTILDYFRKLKISKCLQLLKTYIKIKSTGNWYHIYESVLKNRPKYGDFDIAVAYAGPSDFITYFIAEKVCAQRKIQWIHFDIEKIMDNFSFGKKYYPFFNKIFCVSQSAKDIFLKHFEQLESKTEVFHNIVSESELKKQAESGETYEDGFAGIRILTVGRFTKEKGQHLIPAVAKKLKSENIRFRWYLVGNGKEKAAVEQLSLDLGVRNDLVFLGEKENPYRYMQDCDIYVQPSLHEGFGITVEEAKVFNKPIVVTGFASAKDLIRHNDTGLIAEISEESLYFNLKTLIVQPELQTKFKNNLEQDISENTHADILSKLMS